MVFDCCLKIKRLLASNHTASNHTYPPLPMPKPDNIDSCITLTGKSTPSDPDMSSTIATFSTLEISTFPISNSCKTRVPIDSLHSSTDSSFVDQTETEFSTQTIGIVPNLSPCSLMEQSNDCHTVGSQVSDSTPNASLSSKCLTQYLHLYQLLLVMMHSCLIPLIVIVPLKHMLAMSSCPLNVSRLQESSPHWLYLVWHTLVYISLCSFIQMWLPSPQMVSYLRQSSYVCHGWQYLILYMYTIANSNLCIIIMFSQQIVLIVKGTKENGLVRLLPLSTFIRKL